MDLPVPLTNQAAWRNSEENIKAWLEFSALLSPLFPPAACELGCCFSIQSQSYIVITGADICSHSIHFLKITNIKQKVGFTQLILDLHSCSHGAGFFFSSSSPCFHESSSKETLKLLKLSFGLHCNDHFCGMFAPLCF